jgi:membrane protease YdiL (CAAX protease family)
VKRVPAWPVFAAYLAALALCIVASQELVLAVARSRAAGDPARLAAEASRFALSAQGLAAVATIDALVLLGLSLAAARLMDARAPLASQLALGASRATPVGLLASAAGVTGLSLACGAAADLVGVGQGPVMRVIEEALGASAGPGAFAPSLLALAVAPGLAEETFFRGLMQSRLSSSWGRGPAIVASAACFGALHLDLVQGTLAFVVGLLLGWIASHFGSVRPAALAHVTNNALFVVLARLHLSSAPPGGSRAALGVGAAVTIASIALLRSSRASIRAS